MYMAMPLTVSWPARRSKTNRAVPEAVASTSSSAPRASAGCGATSNVAVHCRAGIGRTGLVIGSVLVRDGQIDNKALKNEALTREELIEVIHRQGFEHIHEVHHCELEPNGSFYIEAKDPSIADKRHDELLTRLDALSKELDALKA